MNKSYINGGCCTVAALGILFRVVIKKFKLSQYFSWYYLLRKNELEIIFIE